MLEWLDLTGCTGLAPGIEVVLSLAKGGPTMSTMTCCCLHYLFSDCCLSSLHVVLPQSVFQGLQAQAPSCYQHLQTLRGVLLQEEQEATDEASSDSLNALRVLTADDVHPSRLGAKSALLDALGALGPLVQAAPLALLKQAVRALRLPVRGTKAQLNNRIACHLWRALSVLWLLKHSWGDAVAAAAALGRSASPTLRALADYKRGAAAQSRDEVDVPAVTASLEELLTAVDPRRAGQQQAQREQLTLDIAARQPWDAMVVVHIAGEAALTESLGSEVENAAVTAGDGEGGAAAAADAAVTAGDGEGGAAAAAGGAPRLPPSVAVPDAMASPAGGASPRAASEHCSSGACPLLGEEGTPGVARGARAERHSSSRHSSSSISRRLVFREDDEEHSTVAPRGLSAPAAAGAKSGPRVITMQQYLQSVAGSAAPLPRATMVPVRSPASSGARALATSAALPSASGRTSATAGSSGGGRSRRAGRMAQLGAAAGAASAGTLHSPPFPATARGVGSTARTPQAVAAPGLAAKRLRSALDTPPDGLAPAKRAASGTAAPISPALRDARSISSSAHKTALLTSAAYRDLVSAQQRCGRLTGRDAAHSLAGLLVASRSSPERQSAEWREAVTRGGHFAALLVCKHLLLRRALLQSAEEVQHSCPDALRLLHDTVMAEYKRNKEQLRAKRCLPKL